MNLHPQVAENFLRRAKAVEERLREELEKELDQRGVDFLDDIQLDNALRRVLEMIDSVEKDTIPPRQQRRPMISRMIIDSWPLGTQIGNMVGDLEREYIRM